MGGISLADALALCELLAAPIPSATSPQHCDSPALGETGRAVGSASEKCCRSAVNCLVTYQKVIGACAAGLLRSRWFFRWLPIESRIARASLR
jgi:hypothetical protein